MPRPVSYQRDDILQRAVQVFWRQGYLGTSVKDLVAATRLQPGSLYSAFRSKQGLYRAALDCYFEASLRDVRRILQGPGSPLARVRALFNHLCEACERDPDGRGCLLVNALVQMPVDDDELAARLAAMFAAMEAEFVRVLEEARRCGELGEEKEPQACARLLLTGLYGLRVYQRGRPSLDELRQVVNDLLDALR